ncbi:TPA: hypothetical protein EYP38_01095, partial [Candidatus Micrarchaeota archaeon]|nr:hypothetical protein [Candidatus Micrarchaeota archaeon]
MGGEQSRLKPRDAQPSENTKRRRPVRNTLKKILAYVTVAATFGATGALSRAVRAEQARAVEEDEAVTQRRALAREAAESLRSLMRERSTEGAERFLEIIDEQAADPEFHTELERQIQSLIRVDGEGGATPEDAFIAAWAEEYAEDGRIEYDLLVQDIQLLHAAAYEAVDALRNFLITGDTDERTRFEDSFRREFLGQPARANLFYTRAFADGFQHRLRDDEGAHAIERAYALSTSRAGRALHACYEQAAEAGSVEDAPEALVAEHGAEFVRLFIELRDELGLSGQSENAMILFFEDHEDEPGEDADDDYRTAHGRASRLLRALGFNISGLVRDVSAVYMAFEGDERPDAEGTRELERQFGRRLVELVEERAAPAEVDEEEESRRERRYQLLLSDAFSAFINMDTLIQPGETSLQTSTLERYERTYERSPVTQQVAFGRWAADALGAWDRLDHNDLAQVRRYFRQYFPRLPMPSEEHLPRFNVAMTVMSAHVRYGSFRFESYMTQLRDSADAFASYLAVCSRRDSVSWTGPMQEAFTATVIERSQAARRGRLPREVRIPEGGGAGADLANELIPAVT